MRPAVRTAPLPLQRTMAEAARRDGCPLIRNLVSTVAEHLARTAHVEESAAIVRKAVLDVMEVRPQHEGPAN